MLFLTPEQKLLLDKNEIRYKTKVTIQRNELQDTDELNHTDITSIVGQINLAYDLDRRNSTLSLSLDNSSGLYTPNNKSSEVNIWVNPSTGILKYNPLIYPRHKIRVWFYLDDQTLDNPFAIGSNNPAWQVFTGITGDDISVDTDDFTIGLNLRDKSKALQDTYIELSRSYDFMLAEDVILDILSVHMNGEYAYSTDPNDLRENVFICPQPTQYLIDHYQAKDTNVWDAIQKIADLMGWCLRFNGKGQLLFYLQPLTLELPLGGDTTYPYPFGFNIPVPSGNYPYKGDYYEITPDSIINDSQQFSDADIRNDIIIKSQNQNYDYIEARYRDLDSIDEFGKRPMIVSLDLSAYINTFNQAYQLAKRICMDLSWIHEKESYSAPLMPWLEVDDIIKLENPRSSTNVDIDDIKVFKIQNYNLRYEARQKRSQIDLIAFKNITPPNSSIPKAPTGLSAPESGFATRSDYIFDSTTGTWSKEQQIIKYPKLNWNPVIENTLGNEIDNLGGYTIYRRQFEPSLIYMTNLIKRPVEVDNQINGQTFSPSIPFNRVYLYVCANTPSNSITVEIRDRIDGSPLTLYVDENGIEIKSQTFTNVPDGTWLEIPLNEVRQAMVEGGNPYYVTWTTTQSTDGVGVYSTQVGTNQYGGGSGYKDSVSQNYDYAIRWGERYRAVSSVRAYFPQVNIQAPREPIAYYIDYKMLPLTISNLYYTYKVTAHNTDGIESNPSNECDVIVPQVIMQ